MVLSNTQTVNPVTLKITSSVDCVSPLGEAIQVLCLYETGSESFANDVQRAVVEALNNVILHAYHNHEGHDIVVQWKREDNRIRIDITDYGLSMSALPPPKLPNFEAESGRGWWIINACCDDYYYKVEEFIKRDRMYKENGQNEYSEQIVVNSHSNVLTLIKYF